MSHGIRSTVTGADFTGQPSLGNLHWATFTGQPSLGNLRTRAPEKLVLRVPAGILDDVVQEVVQKAAELRPGSDADRDQVAAVHGEILQPMRAPALMEQQLPEAGELLQILVRG